MMILSILCLFFLELLSTVNSSNIIFASSYNVAYKYNPGTPSEDAIRSYHVSSNGTFDLLHRVQDDMVVNPTWMTQLDSTLYVCSESEPGKLHAYFIHANGLLAKLNTVSVTVPQVVHSSVSTDKKVLFAASYAGGISAFPILSNGHLGSVLSEVRFSDFSNVDPQRQEAPHPHHIVEKDNFVFVCDLGADKIRQFIWDGTALIPNPTQDVVTEAGAGPRHLMFHPRLNVAYVVMELQNKLVQYSYDAVTGLLTKSASYSTLPQDIPDDNYNIAAAIHFVTRGDNDYLLISNRGGHNSIASFKLKPDGTAEYISDTLTGGESPREFVILQNNLLLVANQVTSSIASFYFDPLTGKLSPTETPSAKMDSSVCLIVKD